MSDRLPGFRLLEQLGVGARSRINLGVEVKSGKRFAVKHVVRQPSEDERFLKQVETEFVVGSSVDHENLRKAHAIHRVRKLLQTREVYLVMELIEGLTLDRARPNRLNTFLSLFHKVAAGLHAMHEAGYVHTDLKPINIMLAPKVVKIIDYGQACRIGLRKPRIQGTPDYIAPEQVRRLPMEIRTDVFNLGATMYWVLTSQSYPTEIRANDGESGFSIVQAKRAVAPVELNDKIPISLSNLIMECCRENPTERPPDMKQVIARLSTIQKLWRRHREAAREQRGKSTIQPNDPSKDDAQ